MVNIASDGIETRKDTETGVSYYYSHHTGETSWSRSELVSSDTTGHHPEIVRKFTEDGRIYFENTRTEKTGWLKSDVIDPESQSSQKKTAEASVAEENPTPTKTKKRTGIKDPIKHREFAKEGYMLKKAGKLQNWARRWFKLDAYNKQLLLYKNNDKNAQLKGIIELTASFVEGSQTGIHQLVITSEKKQRYAIRAESDAELAAWLHHLKVVTEQDLGEATNGGSDQDEDEDEMGDGLGELQPKHGSTLSSASGRTSLARSSSGRNSLVRSSSGRDSLMMGSLGGDLSEEQYESFKQDLEGGSISMIVHPRSGSPEVQIISLEVIQEHFAITWGGKLTATGRVSGSSMRISDLIIATDTAHCGGASQKQKRASMAAQSCFFCLMDREKTLVVEAPTSQDKSRMIVGLTQLVADVQLLEKSGRRVSKMQSRQSLSIHAKKSGMRRASAMEGLSVAVKAEKRRQSEMVGGSLTAENLAALQKMGLDSAAPIKQGPDLSLYAGKRVSVAAGKGKQRASVAAGGKRVSVAAGSRRTSNRASTVRRQGSAGGRKSVRPPVLTEAEEKSEEEKLRQYFASQQSQ